MHISQLSIKRFRLFEDFHLALDPGLNVIVGENNSGKTAVLDAIRLTLDTNSAEWSRLSEYDFHTGADELEIQIKFEGIQPDQAHVFVEHISHEEIEPGKKASVLYVNLLASRTDALRRGSRVIRSELRSGAKAEGPAIEREIREYLSATYLKPLRDAEAELSAGRNSRLVQILSAATAFDRTGNSFRELLEGLITASEAAKNNPGIITSRDHINRNFDKLTFANDKDKFNLAVQMLGSKQYNQMSKVERERAFQDILQRLSLTLDDAKPLQGLGYNNVLFMATELILLEQEEDEFPLLLIEEPEAHLHPQLQMKFLKFIREQYSQHGVHKIQTILTTHSPNLASKAPLESVIVMKDGKAFPMKKGVTGLSDDDYVFLEKFLDVTKSNLFFAKAVLIVEGDGENILLPTIAKQMGLPLEDHGVSVVNVGSTAYARFARIFLRAGQDANPAAWMPIRIACLRDLDLWPLRADENEAPGIGFKELKSKNKPYWLPRIDENGQDFGTDAQAKTDTLNQLSGQNVKVFVSEEWTFEYCLIKGGFTKAVFDIVKPGGMNFSDLSADAEDRAIQIYGMAADSKTKVAYGISARLEKWKVRELGAKVLRTALPPYIVGAIDYVTYNDPTPINGPAGQIAPLIQAIDVPAVDAVAENGAAQ